MNTIHTEGCLNEGDDSDIVDHLQSVSLSDLFALPALSFDFR